MHEHTMYEHTMYEHTVYGMISMVWSVWYGHLRASDQHARLFGHDCEMRRHEARSREASDRTQRGTAHGHLGKHSMSIGE
jgi:hypothetical protein